jgi:hypothetical protein
VRDDDPEYKREGRPENDRNKDAEKELHCAIKGFPQ